MSLTLTLQNAVSGLKVNQGLLDLAASPDLAAHHANFLECIRTGARPNADIEINHLSTALCHLGNIATRAGRVIHFDPAKEQITGDSEAAMLLTREYRDHWAKPVTS